MALMLASELSKPNLRRILFNSFLWQCFLLSLPVLSSPTKHQSVKPLQTQPNLHNFQMQNFKISKKIEIMTFLNTQRTFPCKNESPMRRRWQNNTVGQSRSGRSGFSANMFGFQLGSNLYRHAVGHTHTEF
jgi:hypothetical protein